MKKSRYLIILLFALVPALYGENSGESFDIQIVTGGTNSDYSCNITGLDNERILSGLDGGDTIRIRLWVKEWTESGKGWKKESIQSIYTVHASWNVIDKMYVIEKENSREYYLHKDAFLENLLTFSSVPVKGYPLTAQIRMRADILWQVLPPPLNILSPLLPKLRSSIPWTTVFPEEGP